MAKATNKSRIGDDRAQEHLKHNKNGLARVRLLPTAAGEQRELPCYQCKLHLKSGHNFSGFPTQLRGAVYQVGFLLPKAGKLPVEEWEKNQLRCEDKQQEMTVTTSEKSQPKWMEQASAYFLHSGRRVGAGLAIVIAVSLGYHATFGANGLTDYRQKRNQHEVLQQEIVRLQQQNSRLQDHVQHLQSDPDAIEHEARVILRYAKPGEVIYGLNEKAGPKPAAR